MQKMKRTDSGWVVEQHLEPGGCDHKRTYEVSGVMDGEPAMAVVCYDCERVLAEATAVQYER